MAESSSADRLVPHPRPVVPIRGPEPGTASVPVPLTTFVGREAMVASAVALLQRDDVRLMTLVGPGGVGKTRLVIAIAGNAREFLDEVAFVSLGSVTDPDLVVPTVATALGVRQVGDRPPIEFLMDLLRRWHGLLVLDNFEQVLPAAPFIAGLLAACPRLKVLVTSRTALGRAGLSRLDTHRSR